MELITKKFADADDEQINVLVKGSFPNVPIAMLTLLQFACMDSIAAIYHPLIVHDLTLLLFFLPFILVVSISLMNLITAIIVEAAIEQGKQDREALARYKQARVKSLLPSLKQLFKDFDADGDETVTISEIKNANEEVRQQLEGFMQVDSLEELFEMIDVDGSGEIDIDEFCDGISKVVSSDIDVETMRMLKQLSVIRKELKDLKSSVGNLGARMAQVREQLGGILKQTAESSRKGRTTQGKHDVM